MLFLADMNEFMELYSHLGLNFYFSQNLHRDFEGVMILKEKDTIF